MITVPVRFEALSPLGAAAARRRGCCTCCRRRVGRRGEGCKLYYSISIHRPFSIYLCLHPLCSVVIILTRGSTPITIVLATVNVNSECFFYVFFFTNLPYSYRSMLLPYPQSINLPYPSYRILNPPYPPYRTCIRIGRASVERRRAHTGRVLPLPDNVPLALHRCNTGTITVGWITVSIGLR